MCVKNILIILLVVAIALIAVIYDGLYNPAHHTLPPDPNAIYTIGRELTPAVRNPAGIVSVSNFTVNYKTHWLGSEVTGSVLIGRSTADLAPYVGRRITFEGSVNHFATQQCIEDQCHALFGGPQSGTVIDIVSLSAR